MEQSNADKDITKSFKNGDRLVLKLTQSSFAGFEPTQLWELFYAEQTEDGFNAFKTEYFPKWCASQAHAAFQSRLSSDNPMEYSDRGFALDEVLVKKVDPVIQAASDYIEDDYFHEHQQIRG